MERKYHIVGREGHRSPCLAHAKRALYHLSYTPILQLQNNLTRGRQGRLAHLSCCITFVTNKSFAILISSQYLLRLRLWHSLALRTSMKSRQDAPPCHPARHIQQKRGNQKPHTPSTTAPFCAGKMEEDSGSRRTLSSTTTIPIIIF